MHKIVPFRDDKIAGNHYFRYFGGSKWTQGGYPKILKSEKSQNLR